MALRVRVREDGSVDGDLDAVVLLLRAARGTVALTGAGISVESGIPDFRSPEGLWTVFDPMEYATRSCFERDPAKAWRLYRAIGRSLSGKTPNPAHRALAELEAAGLLSGVVTQNVDGLHQAAGSRLVLEIHGRGDALRCPGCPWSGPLLALHLDPGPVPACPICGRPLKPDFVLFEEPVRAMDAIERLLDQTDLLLAIGTSAQVAPACLFPERVRAAGGSIIEFNVEPALSDRTLGPAGGVVQGRAGATLPRVARRALDGP